MIALWGDREWVPGDEAAAAAGLEPAFIARAWRAAGLPDRAPEPGTHRFADPDVELFRIIRAGIDLLGEDVTIHLLRVIGAAAARVADAAASAFLVNVAAPAARHDTSGLALARANVESLSLLDGVTRAFDTLLRHHLERTIRPFDVLDKLSGIDLVRCTVGFADLVDSTAWGQQLALHELAPALTRFDDVASEIVVERGGRVVKLIGDEVMFVADEAGPALEIAFALIDAFAAHEMLPAVRIGIATGELVARDGDVSGSVVNIAARAVKLASPSSLLVDDATRTALRGSAAFTCTEGRPHAIKGFAEPVHLCQVRRRV